MRTILFSVLVFLCGVVHSQQQFSTEEKAQLQKGELVIWEKPVEEAPWPETTSFALLDISPIEGLAIFSDFEAQQNYIPRVLESGVKEYKKPWEIYASIKAEVPWPVKESNYTTGNILEQSDNKHYRLTWYFVEAEHFNDTYGYISFQPYGDKTLMIYSSFVDPMTPFLAKLFQGKVRSENLEVVKAIRDHLNSFVNKTTSSYLKTRIDKIKNALMEKAK